MQLGFQFKGKLSFLQKFKQTLLVMKLTAILLIGFFMQVSASGTAQNVTFKGKNVPLTAVFKAFHQQTGYNFLYTYELVEKAGNVDVNLNNVPLTTALNICLDNSTLTYSIMEGTVLIEQRPVSSYKEMWEQMKEQNKAITVSGVVTDGSGKPLEGVSVILKGTSVGTQTNAGGEYSIETEEARGTLVFSFVGYWMQEVEIKGRREINVKLELKSNSLDETVVIGYGTTTRTKNTGSISSITSEEISKQPLQNPLNALQGRIAGALVTQSNGLPGARVTIQIRGVNSIDQTGAGTQPLYIVDGIPFNMNDNSVPATNDINARGQFAAAGGLSPFSIINPADIERIDVLKDADATAIYGTRGSNGVVLITTKKGKTGKTRLDMNVYHGQGKVGHFIPMMNTVQYINMRKRAYANDGTTPNATLAPDLFVWDQTAYTDWQRKYMGGTGNISDMQATVSGGDEKTRFLLGGAYHRETPVFPGDYKTRRISTRLNVDHTSLNRKFNANVSVNYAFDNTNLLGRDLSSLYNLPPNMPLYNTDGSLSWNTNFANPESYLFVKYLGKTHNLMTNTILRYTILPGLDLKAGFGYNRIQLDQNTQTPAASKNPLNTALTNSASFAYINQNGYIFEPQITYNRNILKGRLSALLGSTFQNTLNTALRLSGDNYSTASLLGSISGAGTSTIPTYGYTQYRYNSVFGRLTYDWESKYLFNAVLRRDGSSRFGPGMKFGDFWSLGAGWVFSGEDFAKSLSFLSFGKLRASYGRTGSDQIQDYMYRTFFTSSGTYQNNAVVVPDKIENSLLHWQNTYKLEFGLDMAFVNRKIEATFNYYRNRTPDQLGYLNLSAQTGFNAYISNFDAVIQNTGVELELNTKNINGKDFRWSSSLNLTIPRTKLISASPSYFYYNESILGKPLSLALRYTYMGVDDATGKPMYKNVTNDTLTFTPNYNTDRAMVGYTAPKMYGGLNNILSYKSLELSFFLQFTRQDGNIKPTSTPGILSSGNQSAFWLNDHWTKAGETTGLPRYTTTSSVYSSWSSSSAVWGDASFLRLRTVNISYTIPQNLISRWKLDNLRVYLQGQNLWWTSKNKYVFDPETGTAMPPLRVITAGLNISL